MDVWNILQVIRNRKWTIGITAVLACVLIMLSDTAPEARFRSSAKLLFNAEQSSARSTDPSLPMPSAGWLGDPVILKELMLSQDFLEKHVIATTQLKTGWGDLRDNLDMKALSGGNGSATMVEIDAEDADPKQSQIIAQAVADGFLQYIPEVMAREYDGNRKFLERLVGEAKAQLDDAEASILSWQDSHHFLSAGDAYQEQLKSMSHLEEQRAILAQQAAAAQARLDELKSYKAGDTPPLSAIEGSLEGRNSHVAELQQLLAIQRARLDDMNATFKPTEPSVVAQTDKVKKLQSELNDEIKADVVSMRTEREGQLKEAQSQMQSLDATLKTMHGKMAVGRDNLDFAKRQRDIDLWEKNYQELISNLYRARIIEQNASRRGAITELEAPSPGVRVTVVPKTFQKRLSIAVIVSMVLGIGVALALEFISRSLRVATSVEEVLELRMLGTIPRLPKETVAAWRDNKQQLITGSLSRPAGKAQGQAAPPAPK
jgi:uncharacterized protein involved in exopolysaccharide biosynthesis